MAIKFKAQARKNPQDVNLPEKYYAAAIADGEVDMDTLAEQISYQCTVTESDCYAVLLSLERNIIDALKQGRIVKLGRLGNFQVGLSSEGRDTELAVDANAITKTRILFRPGKRLRNLLNELIFRKAS
ncbi:HU family DNA-binding protein [Mariniflexile maritimum]|jgi:predicted histone-like DNA-binding protein|uniref:HU family DNA-binding protein n=1 Tax=Mariniflexile maritimum TaxID=2682493 RepID=UPI0012F6BA90|nr:HU family DNA-binding protein [Mariniflexile maritimum]MCB0450993.1 HU family DNA-binding protein [Confluentibacter sp.]HMR16343.1 HU family DNA-binding protein [Mariniflexile sp.]